MVHRYTLFNKGAIAVESFFSGENLKERYMVFFREIFCRECEPN
jgi:hypothetical protein